MSTDIPALWAETTAKLAERFGTRVPTLLSQFTTNPQGSQES